jgi:histidinol-phosphate/aromatic aminotransferase/cobyric acid decarboxylase-like protein
VGARAVVAALGEAATLIPQRRAGLIKVRSDLCAWLRARDLRYIEPHANFLMIDTGVDARQLGLDLLKKDVAVGRPFPPLDKMLRVTIGTAEDMAKFQRAFAEVYKG